MWEPSQWARREASAFVTALQQAMDRRKSLELEAPAPLLARADEVIES
jgi:hypothetical protein